MANRDKHLLRKLLLVCAVTFVILIVCAAGYVFYLNVNYTRTADDVEVPNDGATPELAMVSSGDTYTALTYNVGFGAYTPDFSFFMETGTMKDGTPT